MSDVEVRSLNVEFGRLAAARKIMAVRGSTGSLADDRVNAERWIARFGSTEEPDDASIDASEDSVIIRPAQEDAAGPYVLYIHGGGMVYYSTAVFRPFLRDLANTLHAPVEAFEYPKAPEHTVEEAVERLGRHITERCRTLGDRPLVLAGDSVGGLLSLYLSLRVLPGVFSRIVLIYPVLELGTERESYRTYGEGYFLDSDSMRLFKSILKPFFSGRDFDPFALSDSDLARLPACSIVTAGCDVLRDEGLAWAEQLADRPAGLRHQHFPDLPHDFCLYTGKLNSAKNAVTEIARTAFSG
ncbi:MULTISPECIES: alpha/beta hydrolase fold domain-containing protein [unclassified Streptomyces]|uniref:alpha/beta hydrolase fold domain-containing protein n=1 Tax=unclassified Streptomyces TaxID=2593676 RepID=UPI0023656874|nr:MULTISPECIES: alpha/beta hydrolase fold domain-containing protein [unclassified Streptomyces]MDF3142353.1 alpha/beta hydrolase fold domain-containing protein [Streptomyces sp. T21Q-yed]WDF40119.1 alpha/beta hydrolase fold domain-containing protein [Streptomyces sp. T12]